MEEIILRENCVLHLGHLTLGASRFWENSCVISVLSPPPEVDYCVKQGDLIILGSTQYLVVELVDSDHALGYVKIRPLKNEHKPTV